MNKRVSMAVLVLAVVMLTLPISTAFAASPMIAVSGDIASHVTSNTLTKTAGENMFRYITTTSTWSGDIVGSTVGSQTWIIHTGGDKSHVNINVELFFTTATVDGKTGTMTVEMNLDSWQLNPSENHGTWVIKDAAGGLAGLHGGGDWIVGGGVNRYEGQVHFGS